MSSVGRSRRRRKPAESGSSERLLTAADDASHGVGCLGCLRKWDDDRLAMNMAF